MPDYDYEGYHRKYGPAKPDGHYPDEFKLPNHITFSTDSQHHSEATPGGRWEKANGRWQYTPSDFVLQQHGEEKLRQYFQDNEPEAVLNLPVRKRLGGLP